MAFRRATIGRAHPPTRAGASSMRRSPGMSLSAEGSDPRVSSSLTRAAAPSVRASKGYIWVEGLLGVDTFDRFRVRTSHPANVSVNGRVIEEGGIYGVPLPQLSSPSQIRSAVLPAESLSDAGIRMSVGAMGWRHASLSCCIRVAQATKGERRQADARCLRPSRQLKCGQSRF